MNEVARESIRKDENFHNGNYYEHDVIPKNGIKTSKNAWSHYISFRRTYGFKIWEKISR